MRTFHYFILQLIFVMAHANTQIISSIKPDLNQLAANNQLIMFGELHGTQQMPRYFAEVVGQLVSNNTPLKVGIEFQADQLAYLIQYLNSSGSEGDKQQLIKNSYWSAQYQDGRTSQAMFDLIERIRQLKKLGHVIQVFVFDDQISADREKGMADHVMKELEKDPEILHVLITGNIHSQTSIGTPWNQTYLTMGVHISEKHPKTTSVVFTHSGGDAWLCTPDCKKTVFQIKELEAVAKITPAPEQLKHNYKIEVGIIATSYPAYLSGQ